MLSIIIAGVFLKSIMVFLVILVLAVIGFFSLFRK